MSIVSIRVKSAAVGIIGILSLAACSYNHGIMRILTFDHNVIDLNCLSNELGKLGYKVKYHNESISYELQLNDTYPSPSMSISTQKLSNGDGTYKTVPRTLVHSADFGSGPIKCKMVKNMETTLEAIENKILTACNLMPITEPKQHMNCS